MGRVYRLEGRGAQRREGHWSRCKAHVRATCWVVSFLGLVTLLGSWIPTLTHHRVHLTMGLIDPRARGRADLPIPFVTRSMVRVHVTPRRQLTAATPSWAIPTFHAVVMKGPPQDATYCQVGRWFSSLVQLVLGLRSGNGPSVSDLVSVARDRDRPMCLRKLSLLIAGFSPEASGKRDIAHACGDLPGSMRALAACCLALGPVSESDTPEGLHDVLTSALLCPVLFREIQSDRSFHELAAYARGPVILRGPDELVFDCDHLVFPIATEFCDRLSDVDDPEVCNTIQALLEQAELYRKIDLRPHFEKEALTNACRDWTGPREL